MEEVRSYSWANQTPKVDSLPQDNSQASGYLLTEMEGIHPGLSPTETDILQQTHRMCIKALARNATVISLFFCESAVINIVLIQFKYNAWSY